MNDIIKRVFLVGSARSGTTLLQSMLASHQDIFSFPETHFFDYTVPKNPIIRKFKIYNHQDLKHIISFITKNPHLKTNLIERRKKYYSTNSWTRFLLSIIDTLNNQNKKIWLEKTPTHLYYINLLSSVDPEIRFIHIIRNGEDVIASLHMASHKYPEYWGGKRTIKQCIKRWKKDINISQKYVKNPKHKFILYQQLVNNPDKELHELCRFLSINFTDKMVTNFNDTANSLIQSEETWKSQNRKNLQLKSKFQDYFSQEQQAYIRKQISDINLKTFRV